MLRKGEERVSCWKAFELGKQHGWSPICFWSCHWSLARSPECWERLSRAFCSFSGRGTSWLPDLHSLARKLWRFWPTAVDSITGKKSPWSGVPKAKTSRAYLLYYLHYTAPMFSHCCTWTLIYTVFKHSYRKADFQTQNSCSSCWTCWSQLELGLMFLLVKFLVVLFKRSEFGYGDNKL